MRLKSSVLALLVLLSSSCALVDSFSEPPDGDADADASADADVDADTDADGDTDADADGDTDADADGDTDADADADADADGDTDADADADGDTDADADGELECEIGDTRPCDCTDLPFDAQGTESCTDDNIYGECTGCPVVCDFPGLGTVVEGEPCGTCGAGEYTCDGDTAECSEPLGTNACGVCSDFPTPACTTTEVLVCDDEGIPSCSDDLTTFTVDINGQLEQTRHEVYYLFVETEPEDDPLEACQGDWEASVLNHVPEGYQQATINSVGDDVSTVEFQSVSEPGVVRYLIRQDINPDPDVTDLATTHFACNQPTVTTDAYFHPYPFRGEAEFRLAPQFQSGENPDGANYSSVSNWLLNTLRHFAINPAVLLVGCTEDCTGTSPSINSIVDEFQVRINDSLWPTTAFPGFASFANRWSDNLDAIGAPILIEIYTELFQDYLANNVTGNIGPYDSWRNAGIYNSDGDLWQPLFSQFRYLSRFNYSTVTNGEAPSITAESAVFMHPLSFVFPSTGGSVYVAPPPQPLFVASDITPHIEFSLDLQEVSVPERVFNYDAIGDFMKYLLTEYYPDTLYPQIEFVDDQAQLAPALDLVELFRTAAPCDQVASELGDRGINATHIDTFLTLCHEFYGDPTEVDAVNPPSLKLAELLDRFPYRSPAGISIDLNSFENPCPVDLKPDPFHGLRISQFSDNYCQIRSGSAPEPNIWVYISFGAAQASTFFNVSRFRITTPD